MDKIIALVGESGSGKSTIAELLEKEGYNYIQSYTTRKPRYEGEKGHIFVDVKTYIDATIENEFEDDYMIAYTFFNGEHYWATKSQYQNKGTSIYVIDVAGVKELRQKVKDAEIVVVYLRVDERIRADRMTIRLTEKQPNAKEVEYDAIIQRIKHDKEVFKIVPCDYCIDANRPIEEVLEDVKEVLQGE